ncbi:MAG TPA: hypothetical protein VFV78_12350 [Vicinamibacterales bacterium]|nr:hypothetical protein [Vicinamibacterales bacterium]
MKPLILIVSCVLLMSMASAQVGHVAAADDASAPPSGPQARPSQSDQYTNPSVLMDPRDAYDNDSMIVLLYRYGWAQTGLRLPPEIRNRTLARLNNPKSDRGRNTLFLDVAPVKRLLSWIIVRLDDQNAGGMSHQGLQEHIAALEKRLADAEMAIAELKKKIK